MNSPFPRCTVIVRISVNKYLDNSLRSISYNHPLQQPALHLVLLLLLRTLDTLPAPTNNFVELKGKLLVVG